ncbi:MAG: discoidin domain-containing protein [Acidobacteriota bacterium]|nr:discoidin domain-containing protein [Acidobacteriota bacterium]
MKSRALLALLLTASCSRPAPKPAARSHLPGKLPTDIINERSSLLDVSRGATVVSRTGEAMLATSALNTIDGDLGSFWSSPSHDFPQSIVIALGARSRIDRIGIRSLVEGGFGANHVTFESSLDGTAWQPLATIMSQHVSEGQWLDVVPSQAPSPAAYLRVTILDAANAGRDVRIQSIYARGTEIEPPRNASLDGCWSINGSAAAFAQHGTRATGALALGGQPVFLAGGTNGRLWRFNWIRGNDYGYVALTVAPDGKHLSAIEWHEEAIPLFLGMPWFGERASCGAPDPRDDVPLALLRRAGRVSLFALQFDPAGTLVVEASRDELQSLANIVRVTPNVALVAHEFRQPDARRNKEVAQREIDSVKEALVRLGADITRVTFLAAGSDEPRQTPATDAARAIYSSVDAEVRR